MEIKNRMKAIADMREFLDFLEAHPEAPLPVSVSSGLMCAFATKGELRHAAQAVGGMLEKAAKGSAFYCLRKRFGGVTYDINIHQDQICERVVVGARQIESRTIPAHEEEIVEWRCGGALL